MICRTFCHRIVIAFQTSIDVPASKRTARSCPDPICYLLSATCTSSHACERTIELTSSSRHRVARRRTTGRPLSPRSVHAARDASDDGMRIMEGNEWKVEVIWPPWFRAATAALYGRRAIARWNPVAAARGQRRRVFLVSLGSPLVAAAAVQRNEAMQQNCHARRELMTGLQSVAPPLRR